MRSPIIGVLPLYVELYDKALPEMRGKIQSFYMTIVEELRRHGLQVVESPLCRLEPEFARAVRTFEEEAVDAIVTLHLAYSPSLESADVLASTRLPLIVLDTTPAYEFGVSQSSDQIFFNHGIHGVQDMCNLLIRKGKPFQIEAGHWEHSDVLDRVAGWALAAKMAAELRSARVGLLGEPFRGMGDFVVPEDVLKETLGVEVIRFDPQAVPAYMPAEDSDAVRDEMDRDAVRFEAGGLDEETHRRSVQAGLAIRRWLEEEQLAGFSINFLAANRASGLPAMPFLEICKAMGRGIGYAGEGDVLTAALVGVLASTYPETTFTEMFCPDWAGGSVFLSHMGEVNVALAAERPRLFKKPFPWTDAEDPAVPAMRLKGGTAVFVNLAPGPDNTYTLIIAPGAMLDAESDRMPEWVRGWFRPAMPVADFLEAYSAVGGTHHAALVYGDVTASLIRFGTLMEWDVVVLEG